jgi:hypothetical protein
MKLFPLTRDMPVAERVDLLRKPLRSGPPNGFLGYHRLGLYRLDLLREFKPMLGELFSDPEFEPVLLELLKRATTGGLDADLYAPETLRLAAAAREFDAAFEDSVTLAAEAAELSELIRDRFPYAVSCALIDQAGYTLLAHPDNAQQAVDVCRQAIEAWPAHRDREERLRPLRRSLALYQLAAGKEEEARTIIAALEPGISKGELDTMIGSAAAELYETFLSLPPDSRPQAMEHWLERAVLLADDNRQVALRMRAIRSLLRIDDQEEGRDHLLALAKLIPDADSFVGLLRVLLSELPDHPLLKQAIADVEASAAAQTQPATRPAATQSE